MVLTMIMKSLVQVIIIKISIIIPKARIGSILQLLIKKTRDLIKIMKRHRQKTMRRHIQKIMRRHIQKIMPKLMVIMRKLI